MVNKIIAWIVVAITFVIWRLGYGYIDGLGPDSAMMGAVVMMVITGYMMSRSDVPEGDMMTTIMENGYYIYRSGLQGMPKIKERSSVYWDVASDIKRALDPKDIIARGRYIEPLQASDPPKSESSNP